MSNNIISNHDLFKISKSLYGYSVTLNNVELILIDTEEKDIIIYTLDDHRYSDGISYAKWTDDQIDDFYQEDNVDETYFYDLDKEIYNHLSPIAKKVRDLYNESFDVLLEAIEHDS